MVLYGVVATWFAFDRKIALSGCWGRYEGLYTILYYLSVMLLSTFVSDKYKKVLVHCVLLCGAFQAIYAICQCFNWLNVKQFYKSLRYYDSVHNRYAVKKQAWILGLTNNPNFFGSYMLMCLSYSIGLLLDSKKIIKSVIYCIFIALFTFGLLVSNATSSVVGLSFVCFFALIYIIKNKKFYKLLVLVLIFVSVTVSVVKLNKTTLIKDIKITKTEATEVAKGNLDDSYGTKRMYIWKKTVEIIPKYFWHGVGVDSFHKAFDGEALIRKTETKKILYDKAHNEYLQLLITQGIFALVAYMWLCGFVVIRGLKKGLKSDKYENNLKIIENGKLAENSKGKKKVKKTEKIETTQIYLVLPIIGYMVQAFFNISVIEVAPIFWMALGLCAGNIEKKKCN